MRFCPSDDFMIRNLSFTSLGLYNFNFGFRQNCSAVVLNTGMLYLGLLFSNAICPGLNLDAYSE